MKTLYISYFGAQKHLCETQVISYLQKMARAGIDVTFLSFEEDAGHPDAERAAIAALQKRLTGCQIDWRHLRYHKRPSLLAKLYDVAAGVAYGAYLVKAKRI